MYDLRSICLVPDSYTYRKERQCHEPSVLMYVYIGFVTHSDVCS